jgi:hypothetical protein
MKKMVKLLLLLLVFNTKSQAQVTTALNVQSNPTAVLSDWANQITILSYTVTKTDPIPLAAIIKTEIKLLDGTTVATTDLSKAPTYTLASGTRIFLSKEVLPLEIMQFVGSFKNTLDKTGKLPANSYQINVQLVRPVSFVEISPIRSRNFNVAALQLPILFMPANNSSIDKAIAQNAIIFRWSPLVGNFSALALPTYRLQVFEVLNSQQPIQALRSNQPLLDVNLRGTTQYIWRPQLAFNISDSLPSKFIWTIQTLDERGLPSIPTDGNGESRSEPFVFIVKNVK